MPKATRKKKEKQADFVVCKFHVFRSHKIDPESRKPNSNLVRARSRLRTLPIHPSKRDVSQWFLIIWRSVILNMEWFSDCTPRPRGSQSSTSNFWRRWSIWTDHCQWFDSRGYLYSSQASELRCPEGGIGWTERNIASRREQGSRQSLESIGGIGRRWRCCREERFTRAFGLVSGPSLSSK